jgi:hypothetical protein
VVNAINNRIPLTLPDKPSGEVQAAYDSVSDAGQGAALGDVGLGKFAVHADGFYRHTDNYDTPLGEQANSFFRGDGFSLGSSYFLVATIPAESARQWCITIPNMAYPATSPSSICAKPSTCWVRPSILAETCSRR